MSIQYKRSEDVPTETLANRLDDLADCVSTSRHRMDNEFTMRVPAEHDRDADLVMSEAARRLRDANNTITALRAEVEMWKENSAYYDNESAGRLTTIFELREAIIATLNANGHLADGEDCTLIALKRVLRETGAPWAGDVEGDG